MSAEHVERSLLIPVSSLSCPTFDFWLCNLGGNEADEQGTFGKYLFNPIVAAQNFEYKVSTPFSVGE
jgi:hypothetical protein